MTGPPPGPSSPGIGDHALIGDTRTAALVAVDGAIDWMCVPRFDGEPLFGALVGGSDAGRFTVAPAGPARLVRRRYVEGTATVEHTWRTATGDLALRDAMVARVAGELLPSTLLVRRLVATGGPVVAHVLLDPRLGERHRRPRVRRGGGAVTCDWGGVAVVVETDAGTVVEPGRVAALTVEPGRPRTIVLGVAAREPLVRSGVAAALRAVAADEAAWRAWSAGVDTDGLPQAGAVVRSLLTLRLLTYSPSGAPVAAATTSLPEDVGGVRNWDYRYAWPRDASIGIAAFLAVGKDDEARHFLGWLLHASRLARPRLPALLTIHGRPVPPERVLATWPGFAGSRPVRVGNDAAGQHQLDGYGWVLDGAWRLEAAGHRLYPETWRAMAAFTDHVVATWREPDAGIWEERGAPTHHVHSKLMAWLAVDRALRLADGHRTSGSTRRRWAEARQAIAADVAARGYDGARRSYTRAYGSDDVDAALLVLPDIGIEPADSVEVRGTIDAIRRELGAGGPLVHRYPPGRDGLPGGEGAFLPCSAWLVRALARTGRADEAAALLGQLVALGGDLGLLPEEVDPADGTFLGNHPQALTHAALVHAAVAVRDAGRRQRDVGVAS